MTQRRAGRAGWLAQVSSLCKLREISVWLGVRASQLGVIVLHEVPLLKQIATAYAEFPDAFVARTR